MRREQTNGIFRLAAGGWLLALVLLTGCQAVQRSRGTDVATLERGTFLQQALLTGELESVNATHILAPKTASWRVQIIEMFPEGEFCDAGDVIVRFDPSQLQQSLKDQELALIEVDDQIIRHRATERTALRDLELNLSRAEATLAKAKLDAGVDPSLRPAGEARRYQLEAEKAQVALQKVRDEMTLKKKEGETDLDLLLVNRQKILDEIDYIENSLEVLTVHAPRPGLVVAATNWQEGRKFQVGDSTWPGSEVLQIPDLEEMQVKAWAHELDALSIETGQKVSVVLDMYPESRIPGTVISVSNAPSGKGRQSSIQGFHVLIALDRTDPERMRPGQTVQARVVLHAKRDVVLVPREAVFEDDDGTFVYEASGSGRFTRRDLEVGERNERFYSVTDLEWVGRQVALQEPSA